MRRLVLALTAAALAATTAVAGAAPRAPRPQGSPGIGYIATDNLQLAFLCQDRRGGGYAD